jgi:hypothetical protein
MAGVLIYQSALNQYYSYVVAEDNLYAAVKADIIGNKSNKLLWERGDVSLEQIQNARKTTGSLVARLNKGEKVDLEKELAEFFE